MAIVTAIVAATLCALRERNEIPRRDERSVERAVRWLRALLCVAGGSTDWKRDVASDVARGCVDGSPTVACAEKALVIAVSFGCVRV